MFGKFYNQALRFLSFRSRSEKEIRDYLHKKEVAPATIELIVQKLIEKNFLNDRDFTKLWIEQRIKHKPKSMRVIQMELKQKGITSEIIQEILSTYQVPSIDIQQAQKIVEKMQIRYAAYTSEEKFKKIASLLSRRGFDWDTIKKTLGTGMVDDYFQE